LIWIGDLVIEPGPYCHEIEAFLCRKNDGHLIRIVGPAFELVCGWAERGVPLAVAFRGIDRTFERYYRKGERRRPVRVEFCEPDVLDAFDEWRRAVGVAARGEAGGSRLQSLPAHLDRVAERLSSLAAAERVAAPVTAAVERALAEIEAVRPRARGLRGHARLAALDRLRALDADLVATARATADASLVAALERDAEQELAPFAGRMAADAYARALDVCRDRLLRERLGLPQLSLD
jgi:ubiquinone biosynthesis protein UbiJ